MHDVTKIARVRTHWYREPGLYEMNMLRAATVRQCPRVKKLNENDQLLKNSITHLHCNARKFKRISTYCDNYLDNSSIDDYSGAVVEEFAVWYASCIAVSATPNKSGEEIGQR